MIVNNDETSSGRSAVDYAHPKTALTLTDRNRPIAPKRDIDLHESKSARMSESETKPNGCTYCHSMTYSRRPRATY